MLFFVDESWQTIGGVDVGALGAVAFPQSGYNAFCREFFSMKRDVLGAQELNHSEIRGQHAFREVLLYPPIAFTVTRTGSLRLTASSNS